MTIAATITTMDPPVPNGNELPLPLFTAANSTYLEWDREGDALSVAVRLAVEVAVSDGVTDAVMLRLLDLLGRADTDGDHDGNDSVSFQHSNDV